MSASPRRQMDVSRYLQQYTNVPAPHTFEWGYRRGNPDHNREQYLSQKDHTFKAKVSCHCQPVLTLTLS